MNELYGTLCELNKTTYKKKIKNKTHTHNSWVNTALSYLTASRLKLEAFRSLPQSHRVRKWELAIGRDPPSSGLSVTQNCWILHWRQQLPRVSCHFSVKIFAGTRVCFRSFKDEEPSILEEFQNPFFFSGRFWAYSPSPQLDTNWPWR